MPRQFRLSVCPSVTRVLCVKTDERIIEILSLSDRLIILVFRHQGSLRKSDDFTHNGGAKCKGGCNIRPICGYISETVIHKGIVTMEDITRYGDITRSYVFYGMVPLSMTLSDPEPHAVSRLQYSLKANISQTVHPIHSMFGSRQGFSGSSDRMALFPVR